MMPEPNEGEMRHAQRNKLDKLLRRAGKVRRNMTKAQVKSLQKFSMMQRRRGG